MNKSLNDSQFSLQQKLPSLGTVELISARRKEQLNEVQLAQLLDVSVEIDGLLKTVTEKDIIVKIEAEFKQK